MPVSSLPSAVAAAAAAAAAASTDGRGHPPPPTLGGVGVPSSSSLFPFDPSSSSSSSSVSTLMDPRLTTCNGDHHHHHHLLSGIPGSGVASTSSSSSSSESRTIKLALELALLEVNGNGVSSPHGGGGGGGCGAHGPSSSSSLDLGLSVSSPGPPVGGCSQVSHAPTTNGSSLPIESLCVLLGPPTCSSSSPSSLEDLKIRRSQNMTECVPVPSSEHVAEIVGRQGCKIKALRAKTSTYIKTPVRGDEPVFVVTGRKEDVGLAKREILSAADHFSQIRASRKNQINSTLSFGQMVANAPGQKTVQVRVPYRVVGLVVGPKGATIKRIQQTTHTYIVTPSRDKEPVFEVTGMPENVEAARKEIEAHIALRTGNDFLTDINNYDLDTYSSPSSSVTFNGPSSPHNSSSILNNDSFTASLTNRSIQHLLDEQHHHHNGINIIDQHRSHPPATSVWSGGTDSHDSGIGHSPPFDALAPTTNLSQLVNPSSTLAALATEDVKLASPGIWGELNKVLGNLDMNGGGGGGDPPSRGGFLNVGSRSSLDLGSRAGGGGLVCSSGSSVSSGHNGGHRPSLDLGHVPSSVVPFTAMSIISSEVANCNADEVDSQAVDDSAAAALTASSYSTNPNSTFSTIVSGGDNNKLTGDFLSF